MKTFSLISHYQLYLNGISYKTKISPHTNSLIVRGLTANRQYETTLMVFPKSKALLPQQSNKLIVKSLDKTEEGGPIISMRATRKQDQITIVWQSIDTPKKQIDFYQLMLNNEKYEIVIIKFKIYIF